MSDLILKSINKSYSPTEKKVLDNLELTIEKGEIIALLGESGCGKTTLLRIMAGFIDADSGSMEFKSNIVFDRTKFILPENRKIGFVFQDFALFPHMTVEKNIAFGISEKSKKIRKRTVKGLLERMGLDGLEKRHPYELSGGQQQRVAIARSLAPNPDLVLLDEPFNNLDAGVKSKMFKFVRELFKEFGTTAVFVSHDFKEAEALADKVAVMSGGRIIEYDKTGNIKQTPENIFTRTPVDIGYSF